MDELARLEKGRQVQRNHDGSNIRFEAQQKWWKGVFGDSQ